MCKVSVVLPVYNASKTIDRCIESIVNQTFEDWELICCNDCSEDDSLSMLEKWEKKDSRIKVLKNKKNSRAAFTRNRCIEKAAGEYIALIDDDDYCLPNRLEKQVDFLSSSSEYSFVGSKAYFFDEKGVWKVESLKERPKVKDLAWANPFVNPSIMFRKSDIEKVGLYRIDKETRRTEDYDLFMRLYAEGYYGYNIQEPLIFYYRGKSSFPKNKYEYRIDEARIRYRNFKNLDLPSKYYIYVFKPLIVGIIPKKILHRIKMKLGI